ncbi:DUF4252 domain-containing protein [Chryseobacterium pennipullorum]|uniref:DUF4252 domain-containing protein n=1 Tax=Chryseobacterium pennipullorum TaxID=2258963 RepID=A0A3D9AMG4_9FLAO|nr:DUF4252 domain-containing protein [Chryseobacterium pennipullorum]REC42520.1 DUF4252 domain-containing protein [Chryseobacterium pennipullorum]
MKTLKSILFVILAISLFQSCIVSGRPNIDFFSESRHHYKEARFTSFNVPMFLAKPYLVKSLKEKGKSDEVVSLMKKVSKIKIMMVENGNKEMLNDYARYLNDNRYEDWATIKHNGDNVNVRVNQNGDAIKNMLITVNSSKDMVFVAVKGNFTPNDISKMISSVSDQ